MTTAPKRGLRAKADWWLSGDILGPLRTFGGAMVVVAGPWLVSIAAIALITLFMEPLMGTAAIEDLRLTVVYAFCLAPLTAGPIGAIAGRMIGAGSDGGTTVFGIYLAASSLSAACTLGLGTLVAWSLGLSSFGLAAAFVFLCVAASQLWIAFSVVTALRAHGVLVAAFLGGMTTALLCVLVSARGTPSTEMLIWIFSAGILFCCCLSGMRIRREGPTVDVDLMGETRNLVNALRSNRDLALGVLLAICSVWVDKWILWLGPDALHSAAGFRHYAPYDAVMFVAHITAVPAFTALFLFHEGRLAESVARCRAGLVDGSTFRSLAASKADLIQTVWGGIFTILFFQATFTLCAVLMAPILTSALGLSFDQMLILRTGVMAVFFYGLFFLNCAVLLLANRLRVYMLLQAGFLFLNGAFSFGLYAIDGPGASGFLGATLIATAVSFVVAYRTSASFDYLTVVGENDSLFRSPAR